MKSVLYLLLLLLLSCGGGKKSASNQTSDNIINEVKECQQCAAEQDEESASGQCAESKAKEGNEDFVPLNEIRFGEWTDEDWRDNEYFRTLRRYIDDFQQGKVTNEELEKYKKVMEGQFSIIDAQPFLVGGMWVHFVFLDNPKNVYAAHIYSDVDEDAKKVVGYQVRSLLFDSDDFPYTKEQILELYKKNPGHKLW